MLYLSLISIWEIQIKVQLGKLALPLPLPDLVAEQQRVNGIQLFLIEIAHIYALQNLPYHHRDPFDRLIIAQATVAGLTIVTADQAFAGYGVPLLW
ncbi:MAG: type II toxin-antitoxin system VapC family toxin [Oscillochloris sp.]|nr:type II toxin-antitoxin system VapC family toxin [Oscillochloris sp.]